MQIYRINLVKLLLLQILQLYNLQVSAEKDGRIVGGIETTILYFPHQISLQLEAAHICGGATLKKNIVVTAAHCVTEYYQPELYTVRAGSTDQTQGGIVVPVKQLLPHELYNEPSALNNDIALVLLAVSLQYSPSIQPIPLVTSKDFIPKKAVLFVSGWGLASSDLPEIEKRLRYTIVKEISQGDCKTAYNTTGIITATMLCAGMNGGGHDSCQGDSGGPLIISIAGIWKLYGIVSWGIGCALPEYPGVYTRTSKYMRWITKAIESNFNSVQIAQH